MNVTLDLHTHSKYAGACSDKLTLENMEASALEKGINILSTGDFTHPMWKKEMESKLEGENGIYHIKGSDTGVKFIVGAEVCTIFGDKDAGRGIFDTTGKVKKIHHLILSPSIAAAEAINSALSSFGNLSLDGRPMLNMRASELVEEVLAASRDALIFPAHAWTPWYGVFGSFSGFDSIEDAYEDQAKNIFAIESGLSSDPAMNWRISKLDKYAIISGSDAHSLPKLGREVTMLEMREMTFSGISNCIKKKKLSSTVEFYPEEGKYHFDGHRKCKVSMSPSEAKKYNNICPACRKRITIGVLHRMEELADRDEGYMPKNATPFVHAIPLMEIISYISGKTAYSEYVRSTYLSFVKKFSTELNVLLHASIEDLSEVDQGVAEAIRNIRGNRIRIEPGYDGVFGSLDMLNRDSYKPKPKQRTISEF